eukprot:2216358-Rhodomonas_salina.3
MRDRAGGEEVALVGWRAYCDLKQDVEPVELARPFQSEVANLQPDTPAMTHRACQRGSLQPSTLFSCYRASYRSGASPVLRCRWDGRRHRHGRGVAWASKW